MSVRVTAILVYGVTSPAGQVVTLTDQGTGVVLGTTTSDSQTGAWAVPVPFAQFLSGAGIGAAAASGSTTMRISPPGAGTGAGGGQGVLAQSQPLAGAADGAAAGGGQVGIAGSQTGGGQGAGAGSGVLGVTHYVAGAADGAASGGGGLSSASGGGEISFVAGTWGWTTSSNIDLPAGRAADDILVVVASTNPAAPTGWTRKVNDSGLGVYWRRATNTSADNFNPSGTHIVYAICSYRGCTTSGDPFEAVGASVSSGDTTSGALTVAQITTLTNGAWVLAACAGFDGGWDDGEGSSGANSSPTWATATGPATGNAAGGSYASAPNTRGANLYSSPKTTAGATGTESVRYYMGNYGYYSGGTTTTAILLALKPA